MKKNPWAISAEDEFFAGLHQFYEEAGGLMRLYLVRYNNKHIAAAARQGDPVAITLALAVSKALRQLVEHPRQCVSCLHQFASDAPHAFLLWVPRSNGDAEVENIIAQPVCPACCRANDDAKLLSYGLRLVAEVFDTEEIEEAREFIDEQKTHEG